MHASNVFCGPFWLTDHSGPYRPAHLAAGDGLSASALFHCGKSIKLDAFRETAERSDAPLSSRYLDLFRCRIPTPAMHSHFTNWAKNSFMTVLTLDGTALRVHDLFSRASGL